jgi:hypothetical protein
MKFVLTIDCGNAAFDPLPELEVASIIRELARKMARDIETPTYAGCYALRDSNGNTVGSASFEEEKTGA